MSTEREVTRIVRSWLDEGVNVLPDRVLDAVLDQVPATPQRRASWLARRYPLMNNPAVRFGLAAAAVVLVAILGFGLLNKGGVGGPSATATPLPTASPGILATGNFTSHGARIELDATGEGSNVNGSIVATNVGGDSGTFTVDLACTRTTHSGLIMIGGTVTASTNYDDWAPVGSNVAIVLQRGSPVKAFVHSASPGPCQAFLEGIPDLGEPGFDPSVLEPIAGTIDLGS